MNEEEARDITMQSSVESPPPSLTNSGLNRKVLKRKSEVTNM